MFTVQYEAVNGEHKLQAFDGRTRLKLAAHLARFDRPIIAVYEQASPITKTMRSMLKSWHGTLSHHAREFAFTFRA